MTQHLFKKPIRFSYLIAALLLCLLQPNLSYAKNDHGKKGEAQHQAQPLRITDSNQAAQLAKSRYGGKVLKVSKQKIGGDPAFKVKLVTNDGRIIYVSVNAVTGSVN
ncbi:PepSY domain-containing protein [Shewanella avicenniae]|uniref:PepSY domain-containing protein n=1 Tax=Shewanella avicenniae TaxID=2814294 RepID=A0ABX7QUP0_9GAMM|nr:PepSY domain-containing protein [Shewanella avicenniae]QSX34635.1 PepSY domain-containing protein [Shewanella avicenniae]